MRETQRYEPNSPIGSLAFPGNRSLAMARGAGLKSWMNLYVGTSGYSYKQWKGSFYPERLSAAEMLHFYGEHFHTVEINNTFHRMPKASVLEAWAAAVPPDFRFVLKASQGITHMHRLKNAEDSVAYLLSVAGTLKMRLGPLLFQLPPDLKKDLPRLSNFLMLLPEGCRADYDDGDLKAWAKKLGRQDWEDAFVFFKREDEAKGPKMARRFLELAG